MITELRDLEVDREICNRLFVVDSKSWTESESVMLLNLAIAALNEIDRLKGLLVWPDKYGWVARISTHKFQGGFQTEADAWAAVRKAAMK